MRLTIRQRFLSRIVSNEAHRKGPYRLITSTFVGIIPGKASAARHGGKGSKRARLSGRGESPEFPKNKKGL